MVTEHCFPPDPRIEREAEALISNGYEVAVLSGRRFAGPSFSLYRGITVHYFRCFLLRGVAILNALKMLSLVSKFKPAILHLHDIRLGIYLVLLARILRLPLIIDMHEVWTYLVYMSTANRLLKFMGYVIYHTLERFALRRANAIITVVEEASTALSRRYGIKPYRFTAIRNLAEPSEFELVSPVKDPTLEGQFLLCYFGNLHYPYLRNLDRVIDSIKYLSDIPAIRLVIIGGSPLVGDEKNLKTLRDHAAAAGVADRVIFTGWLPYRKAISHVAASDVCIVPYSKSLFTDTTLPLKVSQYLALGKVVVSTPTRPVVRLLGDHMIVWDGHSSKSLSDIIRQLYQDKPLRISLGETGRNLFRSRFNWDREKRKLERLYQVITKQASVN